MHANVFLPARRQLALLIFLLGAAMFGSAAFAQAPPDPPGRVAQLNYFDGPVSFAPAGYDQWAGAVLNRPLTQGDRLWSDALARSELHIDSTALRMDAQTSLAFSTLDDQTVQLALTQGSLIARLRSLEPGQRFEVDTPNLAFTASQPGDYRIDVDPGAGTTRVTLQSGSAMAFGSDGASVELGAHQQITFSGAALAETAGQVAPALDSFDRWAQARDRAEDQSLAAHHVSREVIGYQQLDNYGDWEDDPAYGAVWVPRVTVQNWAPYSVGHWASIAPWGWTWIDDEPWGFAPFHYGRWAQRGARWCWVPGAIAARPVYAPALVGFVGVSAGGANFSISAGVAARPGVAWFPLAPGEAWRPSYRASPTYITNVNRTVIHNNITNVTNVTNGYRYQHLPAAVTAASLAAFSQGQHVRGNVQPVRIAELQRARVVAPPAATRDPRSVFGASRLTQAHPAPAPEVQARRVISTPALRRGQGFTPPVRGAQPGQAQGPALQVPPLGREPHGQPMPVRGEVPAPQRSAAPAPAPHQPLSQEKIPAQRAQQQMPNGQIQRGQSAPQERAARAQQEQMQRAQNAKYEQAQNEASIRAAQIHAQRTQQEQQSLQTQRSQQEQQRQRVQQEQQMQQAQRSQQEQQRQRVQQEQQMQQAQRAQQQQQMQRVQQEQQKRQVQSEAQRPRPAQGPHGAQVPEKRTQPGGEPKRPHREDQRQGQSN